MQFDLAVVGAGIVGLAHALAAASRGLRVVVIDRDLQANGASIRNFGLVVVTGQEPGISRRRAERSRDVWLGIAEQAGIDILQRGKLVVAQRPEALAVLEAFKAEQHGQGCRLLTSDEAVRQQPGLDGSKITGGLHSPFELRVESREALPKLAAFLSERHAVQFRRGVAVSSIVPPLVADFIGETNQFSATVAGESKVMLDATDLACAPHDLPDGAEATAVIRPVDIIPHGSGATESVGTPENIADVKVEGMEFLGAFWRTRLSSARFKNGILIADFSINAVRRLGIVTGGMMQVELPRERVLVFARNS